MCVVSNVGDYYNQKWNAYPQVNPITPVTVPNQPLFLQPAFPSREEFDALKAEVLEMKDLLIKAKEIDEKTGQKHCEQEDKVKLLKQMADLVGVSLEEVFGK